MSCTPCASPAGGWRTPTAARSAVLDMGPPLLASDGQEHQASREDVMWEPRRALPSLCISAEEEDAAGGRTARPSSSCELQHERPPPWAELFEQLLSQRYPHIDWGLDVRHAGSEDGRPDHGFRTSVAHYLTINMPELMLSFASGTNSTELLLQLDQYYDKLKASPTMDKQVPVSLHVLWQLREWQQGVQHIHFSPREHRALAKHETSPFKVVHQESGCDRSGRSGHVIKVQEAETGHVFAKKSGSYKDLGPELELLERLPESLPHSVSLRASYMHQNQLHLVMEPWGETDLKLFLAQPESLPAWIALSAKAGGKLLQGQMLMGWMSCLAVGLAHLHACRRKHKDIQPGNILLVQSEPCVVHPCFCNFGLSTHSSERSKTTGGCGPQFYKSPEQLSGACRSERAADVFALGCVFLELAFKLAGKKSKALSGKLAKEGYARSDYILDKRFLAHLPSHTPTWASLQHILSGMLEVRVKDRMTAAQVSQHISEMEAAAGRAVHCCFRPPGERDAGAGESSPESAPQQDGVSDSDDEEEAPQLT